nr:hypothetical protein [Actinoplanes sp. NBRC 103695]
MRRSSIVLAAAVLLLGVADAMVGAYLVLYLADVRHLDPVRIGVALSAYALGGIVVSRLLGRRFDRRPTRAYAVAVTGLGGLGLVLITRGRGARRAGGARSRGRPAGGWADPATARRRCCAGSPRPPRP